MEDRVEALAFPIAASTSVSRVEGEWRILRLRARSRAEEDQARGRPDLEMADPELLVDQAGSSSTPRRALSWATRMSGRREELEDMASSARPARHSYWPSALEVGDDISHRSIGRSSMGAE